MENNIESRITGKTDPSIGRPQTYEEWLKRNEQQRQVKEVENRNN